MNRETTWHSLALGDGVAAFVPTRTIKDAFFAAFAAAKGDVSMALFSRQDETHHITLYFSPDARLVAQAFKAQPCEKPSIMGLGLLVGDQRVWELFFPGERLQRSQDR